MKTSDPVAVEVFANLGSQVSVSPEDAERLLRISDHLRESFGQLLAACRRVVVAVRQANRRSNSAAEIRRISLIELENESIIVQQIEQLKELAVMATQEGQPTMAGEIGRYVDQLRLELTALSVEFSGKGN